MVWQITSYITPNENGCTETVLSNLAGSRSALLTGKQ